MLPINLIPVHAFKPAYFNCGQYEYKLAVSLYSSFDLQALGGNVYIFYYKFDYKLTLAKISFTVLHNEAHYHAPKTFTIVGSHDCISAHTHTWDTLREVTNAQWPGYGHTTSFNLPCESRKLYQCYGIKSSARLLSDHFTNIQFTSKTNALR